jgi:hypothetical protein
MSSSSRKQQIERGEIDPLDVAVQLADEPTVAQLPLQLHLQAALYGEEKHAATVEVAPERVRVRDCP